MNFKPGWKIFLILLSWIFLSLDIQAQRIKVHGNVKDSYGEPVVGANVIVKGTTSGTVTDIDGNYQIEAPKDSTLIFSFVGYISQSIPIKNRAEISVILEEDVITLGEVVAIGYGTVKKSDATGAVTQVKPDEINLNSATLLQI